MKHSSVPLQRVMLYLFTAVFTAYGAFFIVRVTLEGGESRINYTAAIPLLLSAGTFMLAALLTRWSPVRSAQVTLAAAGGVGIAFIAELCLVMGPFVLVMFFSPPYVLAMLYPYTLALITGLYARWECRAGTIGPFQWLISSDDALAARVVLIGVLLWSACIFIVTAIASTM